MPVLAEQTQYPRTVVHFWTYACYNCKENMPIYNRWYEEFKSLAATFGSFLRES